MRLLREYCKNSTLHGLKYFAQDDLHWTERLFWAVCCLASAYGTGFVVLATWRGFQSEAVSFVSDTAYLDWNTAFPATTVCNAEDFSSRTEEYLQRRHVAFEEDVDVLTIYKEIAFFYGFCERCYDADTDALWPSGDDFFNITLDINYKCKELFVYCKWNGQEFDCCNKFKPIRTELGLCYSLNSLQTIEKPDASKFFVVNRTTGPGRLEMAFNVAVKIHHHSSEDVPTWNSQLDAEMIQDVEVEEVSDRIISVKETVNEPEFRDLSLHQRRCQFPDEIDFGVHVNDGPRPPVYRYHSFTACEVNCRFTLLKLLCNCTLHHLPKIDKDTPICNQFGLQCIHTNWVLLKALRTSVRREDSTFSCSCLPSCTELEQNVVFSPIEHYWSGRNYSVVRVKMASLPTERLIRIVVRGKLDLVVAAGGIVGLFFGASLLSTVELIYYLLIRPLHP